MATITGIGLTDMFSMTQCFQPRATYAETGALLERLAALPIERLTIEVEEGTFTVPLAEALEGWENLAPGEHYQIIAAHL